VEEEESLSAGALYGRGRKRANCRRTGPKGRRATCCVSENDEPKRANYGKLCTSLRRKGEEKEQERRGEWTGAAGEAGFDNTAG